MIEVRILFETQRAWSMYYECMGNGDLGLESIALGNYRVLCQLSEGKMIVCICCLLYTSRCV